MSRNRTGPAAEKLVNELATLPTLDKKTLRERWKAIYGSEPPARTSRSLMAMAIAYRLQEKAFGGLKLSTRRLLARVGGDASQARPVAATPIRKATPGTVLLRQWHGVIHRVTVLDKGVLFRGKRYRSLSEVTAEITGSRWSGPLFFGLKSATREAQHADS